MARPRAFDEELVMRAVRDQFWRAGYDATSVADLTEVTGLRVQSLYGAFGTKHDMFVRALREYCERQLTGLSASVAAAPSPWEAVVRIALNVDAGRLPLSPWGCLLARSTSELGARDPAVRELGSTLYAAMMKTFTDCVRKAKRTGEIVTQHSTTAIARAAYAASQSIVVMRASMDDDVEFERNRQATELMLRSLVDARDVHA